MIIESWRAQYPARLYPGQQTVDVAEGAPNPLTRPLLSRADTVITHSAAQATQARELAPAATVRTVAMPPHLPGNNQGTERAEVSAPAPTAVLARGDETLIPPRPPRGAMGANHVGEHDENG